MVGYCEQRRQRKTVEDCIAKMRFLLDHGADINVLSADGKTALDIELEKQDQITYEVETPVVATFLREHGAKRAQELGQNV